jgi:hypothetical protein
LGNTLEEKKVLRQMFDIHVRQAHVPNRHQDRET